MCPPRRRLQALRILFSSSVALVLLVLTGLVPMPSAQAAPVVAAVPNTQTEEFGKGAYRPGVDGVTFPRVVHSVDPKYSEAAKQANLEGLVRLDIVIEPDGTVGAVRVLKSLDQKLGLDQAAVDAAWQWTFEPATLHGEKVAVVAQLEMEFRLHSR